MAKTQTKIKPGAHRLQHNNRDATYPPCQTTVEVRQAAEKMYRETSMSLSLIGHTALTEYLQKRGYLPGANGGAE